MTAEDVENDYGLIFDADAIRSKGGLTLAKPLEPAFFSGVFETPGEVSEASIELVFSVAGRSLLLEAKLNVGLKLECARCAEFFRAEFSETFDEVYEDTVKFIDVRGPVKESAALMMPLKPLCSSDCRGLCQVCGGNLNRKACGCAAESGPFRAEAKDGGPFQALKGFSVKRDEKPARKRRK